MKEDIKTVTLDGREINLSGKGLSEEEMVKDRILSNLEKTLRSEEIVEVEIRVYSRPSSIGSLVEETSSYVFKREELAKRRIF